jgi:hypothetical protein
VAAVYAPLVHRVFFWGGWDALVAIGTLALAATTFYLVRGRGKLARASDSELRASWRPVLVARGLMFDSDQAVQVAVENVGRGPALEARAELHGFELPDPGLAHPRGAVIAAGTDFAFTWYLDLQGPTIGRLICQDVTGGVCVTTFLVDVDEHTVRNVETTADYRDVLAVRWWQRPMRKPIVRRRLGLPPGKPSGSSGDADREAAPTPAPELERNGNADT